MTAPPSGRPADPPAPDAAALAEAVAFTESLTTQVERVLVGQRGLVRGLMIGLLADGHVLLEGVPGLAKSLAVQALARALGSSFKRIQFTPDLLPADLVGTHVYDPNSGSWSLHEGPLFAHFVLADEINRAPAKVQSALLEAMQERQVSIGGETRALPDPFLVLATQNPLEQEGTYRLPEAQVDRFMLKLVVDYPTPAEEAEIVDRMARLSNRPQPDPVENGAARVRAARAALDGVHLDPLVRDYAIALVVATREPRAHGLDELADWIRYGASPRASIAMVRAARARAVLEGRHFVTPEDVQEIAPAVLRHRVLRTFEAEAREVDVDAIVAKIVETVPVP